MNEMKVFFSSLSCDGFYADFRRTPEWSAKDKESVSERERLGGK